MWARRTSASSMASRPRSGPPTRPASSRRSQGAERPAMARPVSVVPAASAVPWVPPSSRHDRHVRLPEVGSKGQARIGRRTVLVALDGFAAEVAVRYLAAAGFGRLRVRDPRWGGRAGGVAPAVGVEGEAAPPASAPPTGYDLSDAAARDLARGARAAL